MPLSEEEERILNQIEAQLSASDPKSAQKIGETTLPRYLARNCKWASLAFLVGLAVLIASFATNLIVGVVGFLIMVGASLALVQNLRKMGRHGWDQLNRSVRDRNVNEVLGDTSRRIRRRFGQED